MRNLMPSSGTTDEFLEFVEHHLHAMTYSWDEDGIIRGSSNTESDPIFLFLLPEKPPESFRFVPTA
jgi:hypothetical protein